MSPTWPLCRGSKGLSARNSGRCREAAVVEKGQLVEVRLYFGF